MTARKSQYSRPASDERINAKAIRDWLAVLISIGGLFISARLYLAHQERQASDFNVQFTKYLSDVEAARRLLRGPVVRISDQVSASDLVEADLKLTAVIKLNKNLPQAYVLKAVVARKMGNREIAASLLKEAIARDPKSPNAQNLQGLFALESKNIEAATKAFSDAIANATERQMPLESAVAKLNLANLNIMQGGLTEAKSLLDEPVLNPATEADARNALGNISIQEGDLPAAIAHFERAVELDPDFAGARHNLGCSLLRQGKSEEARRHLDQQAGKSADCTNKPETRPDAYAKGAQSYWQIPPPI